MIRPYLNLKGCVVIILCSVTKIEYCAKSVVYDWMSMWMLWFVAIFLLVVDARFILHEKCRLSFIIRIFIPG